ncbi:stereocilin precursor [Alligator mississippiensis]|uniref:Stereocilin n=1 Tax=Alligator mississippiensis TaxID=8496 RepID=A0A151MIN0_ALLMI|nr:stereocilin precursor [Alligator mississippiensis]
MELLVQVPAADEGALQSLTALLLRRFPPLTPVDLSQFIPFLSASDISSFPPALLANESVLATLQSHSARMTRAQKSAFAQRLLQAPALGDIPAWPPELLRALQPLLPHLPLRRFLQLTPQQVQGLADGWQNVRLGLAQGRHVARSLINRSRGAVEEQVRSIGTLACFLSPEELQALAPLRDPRGPVEQSLLACAADGTLPPHGQVTYALADLLRSAGPEAVEPQELQAWRGVVPELGMGFLQRLSPAQVSALLPELQAAPLTPAQVTEDAQGRLCALLPGLSPESLPAALAPVLAGACECLAPALPRLSFAQTAALLRAMQPHVPALLGNDSRRYRHLPWAPQQAQMLWRTVGAGANVTQDSVW